MSWKATAYVKGLVTAPNGEEITRTEKLLMFVLADYHDVRADEAWPSVKRLARDALLSEQRTKEVRESLVRKGLLVVRQIRHPDGTYASNRYAFSELGTRRGLYEPPVEASTGTRRAAHAEPPVEPSIPSTTSSRVIGALLKAYEETYGDPIRPRMAEVLSDWADRIPESETGLQAIDYAFTAAAKKRADFDYAERILQRLESEGWPESQEAKNERVQAGGRPPTGPDFIGAEEFIRKRDAARAAARAAGL